MRYALPLFFLISVVARSAEPPKWIVDYAKISRQFRYDDLVWARGRRQRARNIVR
jgi:hypothetical protein